MAEDNGGTTQVLVGVGGGGLGVESGEDPRLGDGLGDGDSRTVGESVAGTALPSQETGPDSGKLMLRYRASQLPATNEAQMAAAPRMIRIVDCLWVTVLATGTTRRSRRAPFALPSYQGL
jgi:hypothetical protein